MAFQVEPPMALARNGSDMTDMTHTPATEAANPPSSRPPPRRGRRFNILPERPRLGAYRLCAEIATGGMATVYLADTPGQRIQQPVAIKRIHPHLAKDRTFVEMFYDEAAIASRIRHPNVCHVFDHDVHDGNYFLVMEYLVGEPLSRIVRALRRKHDIDPKEHALTCAAIIAEAARGLHAAHDLVDENGDPLDVVHRDISPDNIFLTFDGVVKVVDFGVASASRQLHRTQTGMLKGKYAYLQPEVLIGARADRRGDVWGLGVVLWEMLTLRRLFHRDSDFQTLRAVSDAEIDPPSSIASEIPDGLDAIVMKALSRDPDERYATAKEVEEALSAFLSAHGGSTSPGKLAGWITGIFPDGLSRQRQFIDIALDDADAPPLDLPMPSSIPPPRHAPSDVLVPPPPPLPTGAPTASDADGRPGTMSVEANSPAKQGTSRAQTPMVMHVAERPRSRRAARLAPTLLASAALGVSIIALSSMGATPASPAPEDARSGLEETRSGTGARDFHDRHGKALEHEPGAADRAGDGDEPEAALRATAITLQLPDEVIEDRRAAQSPPIDLGRGTYRLELTPHEGEWSVTIVPARRQDADLAGSRTKHRNVRRQPRTSSDRLEDLLGPSSGFFRPMEP